MLPLALDVQTLPIAVVGNGHLALRRITMLQEAGARHITVYSPAPDPLLLQKISVISLLPSEQDIREYRLLYITDLTEKEAAPLVQAARKHHVFVNVEDNKVLCDFHVPSIARRGDLLIAVSTGGKSPALARMLRKTIEDHFDTAWEARLQEIEAMRDTWRAQGKSLKEIAEDTENYVRKKAWLTAS